MYLNKNIVIILLFFALTSFTNPNWGPTGHRTVGKIAAMHLSNKATKEINKILDGHTIAWVSTYADEIKSDKNYRKFYSWHYINFPVDGKYETSKKNPKGDLVTGIQSCIAILKDKNSSKQDKNFYLKILVHLIGDLHQPLHVGHAEDKGGNTIQVQWFGKGTNLHH
ncbi:MAG TPA: S1/P1 Nuclease, partial [Flavobacteriia bacterium]|nr:S1/P1 Nuclease [Flavobacteriia bacterium]